MTLRRVAKTKNGTKMPTTEAIYQAAVSDARKPGQTASHIAERIVTNRLLYGKRNHDGKPTKSDRLKELFARLAGDSVTRAEPGVVSCLAGDDQIALVAAMREKALIARDEASNIIELCQSGEMTSTWLATSVDDCLAEGFARRLASEGKIPEQALAKIGLTNTGRSGSFSAEAARSLFDQIPNPENSLRPGFHPITYGQLKTLFELAGDAGTELRLTGAVKRIAEEQGLDGDLPNGYFMSLSEADSCLRANRMYPIIADPMEKSGFRLVEDKAELLDIAPWALDDENLAVCEVTPSMIDHVRGVFLRSGIDMRAEEVGPDAGEEHVGNWMVAVDREKLIAGIGSNSEFERIVEQCANPQGAFAPADVKVESSPDPEHDRQRIPTKAERDQVIAREISDVKKQKAAIDGSGKARTASRERTPGPERGR